MYVRAACASFDIILKRFVVVVDAVVGLESSLFVSLSLSQKLLHFDCTQNQIRESRVKILETAPLKKRLNRI